MTDRAFVHRGFGGEAGPDDIAADVLLTPSREEARAIADTWADARLVADHYAFGVWTGHVGGTRLTVCSTGTGSASTAIAVEELAVLGAGTLLGLGATREPLAPEDGILVAEGAFRADAASHGYVRAGFPAIADVEVTLAAVAAVRASGARLLHGVVADVDAALDARVGVPPRRSPRAVAIEAGIRGAGAVTVHASPAVLLVAGTVHRLRTGFLAADGAPAAQARLREVAVATLLGLAGWDRGSAGAPVSVAARVATLPPAAPTSGS
jgi:uridine phosphorylase